MKKISAPVFGYELTEGTLNKGFPDYRTDALLFCDETCTADLSRQEFYECEFRNITFTQDMSQCLFADCIFERCDFSNCDLHESVFRRCEFRMCRMTGTDLSHSRFQDTVMEGCESSYANYACTKWKISSWKDMSFPETVFMSCTFEDMRISSCRFENADFNDTKLKGLDFSDSDISGMTVDVGDLKGVIMNSEQALACTKLLGIKVKE